MKTELNWDQYTVCSCCCLTPPPPPPITPLPGAVYKLLGKKRMENQPRSFEKVAGYQQVGRSSTRGGSQGEYITLCLPLECK